MIRRANLCESCVRRPVRRRSRDAASCQCRGDGIATRLRMQDRSLDVFSPMIAQKKNAESRKDAPFVGCSN